MESILNLGNQCKSDNAFTKKARLLQSMCWTDKNFQTKIW